MVFCIKLHPKSKLRNQFAKINGDNIVVIDADTDPYVFLKHADVLVTDYSSIYFDYILTGKPIIFFDYDLKEYLHDSREMYFDYNSVTPGDKAENYSELKLSLIKACKSECEYVKNYSMVLKYTLSNVYNKNEKISCVNLYEDISKIIE